MKRVAMKTISYLPDHPFMFGFGEQEPITRERTYDDFQMTATVFDFDGEPAVWVGLDISGVTTGMWEVFAEEIGKVANVRFVETSEAKIFVGGGKDGRDVYATLIFGDNAYGTTSVEGGGLQHIVKQLGSAGTADPLNQRATCGWKALFTAKRLVEQYMVRIETTSTFTGTAESTGSEEVA